MTDKSPGKLRRMTETDLPAVLSWRNHPAIRRHMYTQDEITLKEHRTWWEATKTSPKSRLYIYERDETPLGYVAFSQIAPLSATAHWGFYTAPQAPRGTGSMMTFLAMDEAFGPMALRKVNAEVIKGNAASIGLHESFGFEKEGLFLAHVMIGETLEDVHRLALFADNWQAIRAAKLEKLQERLPQ
ncbi:UDP-4-amino-4,6-dideoxy-N-acetyl-beta-L-altrosamine N-acetyltransferase [Roseobacter sp. CCS2]|uniref:UDP-4-amino-4, 6-dideoxy-N-acetyl-beta-L-altrosamine N-acetyltransferase n=1 Tax=Roseobacter sp. CCS2 TaxID=391593 RepID=UPI0002F44831|nr:UDP-4-amino-4,6-dideoxy-N-acetyl-beta-L-altrosamine N-acetyltransferase [Roseobacter sp. CCS2]